MKSCPATSLLHECPNQSVERGWYLNSHGEWSQPWMSPLLDQIRTSSIDFIFCTTSTPSAHIARCQLQATGATRPRIFRRTMGSLPILVPPISLQQSFRGIASATNEQIAGFSETGILSSQSNPRHHGAACPRRRRDRRVQAFSDQRNRPGVVRVRQRRRRDRAGRGLRCRTDRRGDGPQPPEVACAEYCSFGGSADPGGGRERRRNSARRGAAAETQALLVRRPVLHARWSEQPADVERGGRRPVLCCRTPALRQKALSGLLD